LVKPTNSDHLIYASLVENTRVFDTFSKVLEGYAFSKQLETPSRASRLFCHRAARAARSTNSCEDALA
jgi:hypothetical protein